MRQLCKDGWDRPVNAGSGVGGRSAGRGEPRRNVPVADGKVRMEYLQMSPLILSLSLSLAFKER